MYSCMFESTQSVLLDPGRRAALTVGTSPQRAIFEEKVMEIKTDL